MRRRPECGRPIRCPSMQRGLSRPHMLRISSPGPRLRPCWKRRAAAAASSSPAKTCSPRRPATWPIFCWRRPHPDHEERPVPDKFADLRHELAVANRILAHEGVIDAFGHVSIRHPDDPGRYFLSRSRSPELVEPGDILEFDLDSRPIDPPFVQLYAERVIHGEIFKARPDVVAVCHHHAPAVMPFCISGDPIVPVFHLGAAMRALAPFWDSRDEFGDTNLLVVKPAEGASLARQTFHGADATPWRNRGRLEPARAGFPRRLFLRQCPLLERGQAARQFLAADAGRDRNGASDLSTSHCAEPGLGILGNAARKPRRHARSTDMVLPRRRGRVGRGARPAPRLRPGRLRPGSPPPGRTEGTQMRKPGFATLPLALLAASLAISEVQAQDTLKGAIGQIHNLENQGPTLGQEAGIFKKHGLVLDTFGTAGAGETLQPIISGSADIGIGVGVAGAMRAFSTGAPVRILATAFN